MLREIFATATFRQSQVTVVGTLINGFLGAVFYILLARFLGPSDFGLITVSIASLTLIADIVDFGTNTGLVRHVSANINLEDKKAFNFLKLALVFKLAVWGLVIILGFFLAPLAAQLIFNKAELVVPLRLVSVGVGGALLFSFATSALQAFQKYFVWSLVNIATNTLRLIVILFLFLSSGINLYSGLVSYIVMPFIGFSIASLFLPTKKIIQAKNINGLAKQFFSYNFWVAAFTIIAAVSSRLDTFLSARLLSVFELGLYGAANQLVAVIPQIISGLGVVAAPKFSSFQNKNTMLSYFKKLQLFCMGLAALAIVAIPLLVFLIPWLFGGEYLQAITPFVILYLAMLIFLISLPTHTAVIYFFGRPNVFVWVSLGHFLIVGFLGYFLISQFGIIGAAVTVLIGMIFNLLAPLGWLLMKLKK